MKKIVLFDIDGTLMVLDKYIDSEGSRAVFKQIFNIDAEENMIYTTGKTEKAIIEDVVRFVKGYKEEKEIEVPNSAYKIWSQVIKNLLKKDPAKILPGVKELLEALKTEKDILIGLLTGNSRFRSQVKLETTRLDSYFKKEGVLIGAFGDISSDRSDLIPEAKEKYGVGTLIIIDDSLIAAKMSKESNIPVILLATGKTKEEDLKPYSEFVFKDLGDGRWKEVVKIIKKL